MVDHKHGEFFLKLEEKKEKKDQNKIDQLFFLKKDRLVQYVDMMLKRREILPNLSESERFECSRSMIVAGLQFDELHDLQGEAYAKALDKDIQKYDDAMVELAEWLAKYMRMRKIAGVK